MSAWILSSKEICRDCNVNMEICSLVSDDNVSVVVLWGVLIVLLLLIGGFIRIGTWGSFNCGFSIWESNVSFDGLKLLVIFILFEMEVIVVVIVISVVIVVLLMMITVVELVILYL